MVGQAWCRFQWFVFCVPCAIDGRKYECFVFSSWFFYQQLEIREFRIVSWIQEWLNIRNIRILVSTARSAIHVSRSIGSLVSPGVRGEVASSPAAISSSKSGSSIVETAACRRWKSSSTALWGALLSLPSGGAGGSLLPGGFGERLVGVLRSIDCCFTPPSIRCEWATAESRSSFWMTPLDLRPGKNAQLRWIVRIYSNTLDV